MLLSFRAGNYRSFREEAELSLVPFPEVEAPGRGVLSETAGTETCQALCSAVLSGLAASGKSNLIGALDTFRSILLRGHLRNDRWQNASNPASTALELIPNCTCPEPVPVSFGIRFLTEGLQIGYGFSADLGRFLQGDHPRKVLSETLTVNRERVFQRSDWLEMGDRRRISGLLNQTAGENWDDACLLARGSIRPDELFLMNGFRNIFSRHLAEAIREWLERRLVILFQADVSSPQFQADPLFREDPDFFAKAAAMAAECMEPGSDSLVVARQQDGESLRFLTHIPDAPDGMKYDLIPTETFASGETLRAVWLFPRIAQALRTGATVIADLSGASPDPSFLTGLLRLFHEEEINRRNAQFVVSAHSLSGLKTDELRRDEIRIVERNRNTKVSRCYTLTDIQTDGAVRHQSAQNAQDNQNIHDGRNPAPEGRPDADSNADIPDFSRIAALLNQNAPV